MKTYDIAVIGAGPAGMTAAIYARRAGKSVALFEKNYPGGQMVSAHEIENYPAEGNISGFDLAEKMFAQTTEAGADYIGEEVTALEPGSPLRLKTPQGEYLARAVIIATGTVRSRLNIPGEERLNGRGVSWCAACDGAFETSARVRLSGQEMQVRLADADVVCDLTLMHNSMAEGYARILLTRLALFEAKMLGRICRRPFGGAAYEEAFFLTDGVHALRAEEIVKINARVRVLEEQGAPIGEGTVLRERYAGVPIPALYAQRALSAVYYAALKKGVPRRYFVPDYRARAAAAGTKYADQAVPAPSEYAARAMALERARGELLTEIVHLRREHPAQLREIRARVRLLPFTPDLHELNCLPERAPGGLCAVLRDFGLLENI